MKRKLTLLMLLLTCVGWPTAGNAVGESETLAVIVHPSVPVTTLTRDDLRSIYRRETTFWPNGEPIRPLALPPGSDGRRQFDLAVFGLEPDAIAKYWIDQLVRGGPSPARVVGSPLLLARVVPSLPGSIAWVPQSMVPAGVRVVARLLGTQVQAAQASQPRLVDATGIGAGR